VSLGNGYVVSLLFAFGAASGVHPKSFGSGSKGGRGFLLSCVGCIREQGRCDGMVGC